MKLVNKMLSGKESRRASARRLGLWALGLATAIFALVPLTFDPTEIMLYIPAAFYLPKFKLLMQLSAVLLLAVVGVALIEGRLPTVPVLVPALIFLGVSTVSTVFSGDVVQSLIGATNRHDGLLSLAAGVLLFYAVARFADSWEKIRVFLVAGVFAGTLIAVYGILQQYNLDPVSALNIPWYVAEIPDSPLAQWYGVVSRSFSTLGSPLWLAAYLTLMLGATLALYFLSSQRWERALWLAALAVMGACWAYTYSRGAMLGVGVSLPIVMLLARRRLGNVKPLLTPLAVVVASVFAAYLLSPHSGLLLSRFETAIPNPGQSESISVTARLFMWRDTVPVILERPLIGHGPDNFAEPFARHEGEDLRAMLLEEAVVDKAHNEFLQVAATTGLLGLAAYLWLFISYFRHAYKSGGWMMLVLSGSVLAYILQLQTAFTTIATGVAFWAILGVSVAVMRIQVRDKAQGVENNSIGLSGESAAYTEDTRR